MGTYNKLLFLGRKELHNVCCRISSSALNATTLRIERIVEEMRFRPSPKHCVIPFRTKLAQNNRTLEFEEGWRRTSPSKEVSYHPSS